MPTFPRLTSQAAIIVALCLIAAPQFAKAAPLTSIGWLEGTLTSNGVKPATGTGYSNGAVRITFTRRDGTAISFNTDPAMGGLYVAKDIPAGIYDINVPASTASNSAYRPIRILGVVIAPDKRTVLNIVAQPGEALDVRGDPLIPTVTLTPTAVDAELVALRDRVAALEAKLTAGK